MESQNYPLVPVNRTPKPGEPAPAPPPVPHPAGPPAILTGVNYWHLLAAFRRRWLLAVSLGLVVGAVAAVTTYHFTNPTSYTAVALLHVQSTDPKIMFTTSEGRANFETYSRSQLVLSKSRPVLNAALRDPKVAKLPVVVEQGEDAVDWLDKQIRTEFVGPEHLSISMTGKNKESVQVIVEAVRDAYLDKVVNVDKNERENHLRKIEELYRKYADELRTRRTALRKYNSEILVNSVKGAERRQELLWKSLNNLKEKLSQADSDLNSANAKLTQTRRKAKALEDNTPIPDELLDKVLQKDPEVQAARQAVEALQHDLAEIEKTFQEPTGVRKYKQILETLPKARKILKEREEERRPKVEAAVREDLRHKTRSEVADQEAAVEELKDWQAYLNKQADALETQVRTIGDQAYDLDALNDDIELVKGFAGKFAGEKEALNVEIRAPSRISTLDTYVEKRANLGLKYGAGAGAAGFLAVVAGISLLEFFPRRVRSVSDVSGGLRLPVVGTLPLVNARGSMGGTQRTGDLAQHLLIESVDSARAVLLHAFRRKNVRTVMVSSAGAGEGKTMLSAHLAASIARAGWRVLLVDGDLRRPSLHKVFGVPSDVGLGDVLRGEANLREIIRPGPLPGLWVVPAGNSDTQTMRSLAQHGLTLLLDEIKTEYDFVLIDSAPILPVVDSQLMAQAVDGVVLSVLQNVSRLPAVYAAYERLLLFQADVLGVVVHGTASGAYGHYYPYLPFPAAKATAEKKAE